VKAHDVDVVVGSGPNGLAAAITLAREGLRVTVLEAQETPGGGARTLDVGLPGGLTQDICSAVHPLAWASPFFRSLNLAERVDLMTPEISYAHPLDGGAAGLAYADLDRTVDSLGRDGQAWRSLFSPLVANWQGLAELALSDKRHPPGTLHALRAAPRLGSAVLRHGTSAWRSAFHTEIGAALLTGVATHVIGPLPSLAAAGTAALLGTLAHAGLGWPVPRGGSQSITTAMLDDLQRLGAALELGGRVRARSNLPPATVYLFDTAPGRFSMSLTGSCLRVPPARYLDTATGTRRPRWTSFSANRFHGPIRRSPEPEPSQHPRGQTRLLRGGLCDQGGQRQRC
jgi:phytoene dehydrogenase-like protein